METKQRLEQALHDAMRAQDDVSKRTIRMALSSMKLEEVAQGSALNEDAVIAILQKEVKLRQEAIQDAQKANRADLVEKNEDEIIVLQKFLPQQLSPEELHQLAESVIAELNASGPGDMGKVMKALLPQVAGRAPNDRVSQAVRQILTT
ncbi:MAG: GatB/YqeY domain-containing protein [Chloroflexi bacterium]|nr:GatB/YqeY domain-containing protein [Chloroflexota bacterium]